MALQKEPIMKKCRTLGISPGVMGVSKKESNRFKNANNRKKVSEYGLQLREKQKAKFIYGVLEKPFRNYYEKADRMSGMTGAGRNVCGDAGIRPPTGIWYRIPESVPWLHTRLGQLGRRGGDHISAGRCIRDLYERHITKHIHSSVGRRIRGIDVRPERPRCQTVW